MIKQYTDINQSKKLAEILPLESADNVIVSFGSREGTKKVVMPKETLDVISSPFADIRKTTMCWSLAALLSVLPKLGAEEPMIRKLYYASNPAERYIYQYSLTNMTGEYDNPVDACYEMVLLLKEKNLIWKQQN